MWRGGTHDEADEEEPEGIQAHTDEIQDDGTPKQRTAVEALEPQSIPRAFAGSVWKRLHIDGVVEAEEEGVLHKLGEAETDDRLLGRHHGRLAVGVHAHCDQTCGAGASNRVRTSRAPPHAPRGI